MKKTNAYAEYAERTAKKSPVFKNCLSAFFAGGSVCAFAEILLIFYERLGQSESDARSEVTFTLIFLTALFTGIGIYDRFAKRAGAGSFLPVTGFANSMASAAIEYRSEGFILGVGKQMFTVAGPVIVYGTAASALYGAVLYIRSLL